MHTLKPMFNEKCSYFSWVKGYNGSKVQYIDKSTIVYACGNNINFLKEDGQSTVFTSPGEGVCALGVHQLNKLFAFAEMSLNPRVFVFKYPDMEQVAELAGMCLNLSVRLIR